MTKKSPLQNQLDGYSIAVTGRHVHVTDAMKQYAIEKVSKIERFTDRIIEVAVIMDIQKLDHRAEIILKANQLKIASHATSNDIYVSIDKAVAKIETQLRKYKSRIQEHQARPHHVTDIEVNVYRAPSDEEIFEVNDEIEEANHNALLEAYQPKRIVSHETYPLKLLCNREAVMKMELSQDPFLAYRAEEDLKPKVIYRRKDGNYSVISLETKDR